MQQIDWSKLGFEFTPTRSNIRFHYANGQWDEGKLTSDYSINISVAANVLHYGQAIFEGMKAFRGKDGKVRIFRPDANGRRLNSSARQLVMPVSSLLLFFSLLVSVLYTTLTRRHLQR